MCVDFLQIIRNIQWGIGNWYAGVVCLLSELGFLGSMGLVGL